MTMPTNPGPTNPGPLDAGRISRSIWDGTGALHVVVGAAAQGKTTMLLDIAAAFGSDVAGGVVLHALCGRTESRLRYGVVQQLFAQAPFDRSELPDPLRWVLDGEAPDLASVRRTSWQQLRDLAERRPVLLLVDDVHWADDDSAEVLAHIGRRARGHALGLVLTKAAEAESHPELERFVPARLPGLNEVSVRNLLGGREISDHVLSGIVALCSGNPLVITEFVEMVTDAQLDGLVPLPRRPILGERSLRRLLAEVSGFGAVTRSWLLVLALGPATLTDCVRAGQVLGLDLADLEPAERASVVHTRGGEFGWRSPLVRAAVAQAAPLSESARVSAALAQVTDPLDQEAAHTRYLADALLDPGRAATALARSTVPLARAGKLLDAYEAASRATELTSDRTERERYRIITAELAWLAGYSEHALSLLDRPDVADLSADARTSTLIMRAVIHGFQDSWSTGWRLLPLEDTHEPGSPGHAIRLLVTALTAGWELADHTSLRHMVRRLRHLVAPALEPIPGVVAALERVVVGDSDPSSAQRRALRALAWWAQPSDALHPKTWPPPLLPVFLGEEDSYAQQFSRLLRSEHVQAARSTRVPLLLKLATAQSALGQWDRAVDNATSGARLAEELGQQALRRKLLLTLAWIAASQGDEPTCSAHLHEAIKYEEHGPVGVRMLSWIQGIAALTNGRPTEAFERLHELHHGPASTPDHLVLRRLSTVDAVEVAVRARQPAQARALVDDFATWVAGGAARWAHLDLARSRALLDADDAEHWHQLALELCAASDRPVSRARTELHYGSWLRRRKRYQEARNHLRAAEESFERLGIPPLRQRAHAERRAAGETSHERLSALAGLTPQELEIAKLAAGGLTNPQIANALSLSPRTVAYHLYKVFPKLDITSRAQLTSALGDAVDP